METGTSFRSLGQRVNWSRKLNDISWMLLESLRLGISTLMVLSWSWTMDGNVLLRRWVRNVCPDWGYL